VHSGVTAVAVGLHIGTHLCHDIVDKQCNIIGTVLLQMVTWRFNDNKAISKFAVLADETRDVSGTEQMSLYIRWTHNKLIAQEELLGVCSLKGDDQTAEVLAACLVDVITRCQLSFSDLHGGRVTFCHVSRL